MEIRKITIVDTESNSKKEIMTGAETLGELKKAAVAAGINVTNKDWLEGITHTSMVSEDSVLPTNVEFRGQRTNNLVFALTNTQKKISSGAMSRKEMVDFIKSQHLEATLKAETGKNWTNCSNTILELFVKKHSGRANAPAPKAKTPKNKTPKVETLREELASVATPAQQGVDTPTSEELINGIALMLASFGKDTAQAVIDKANELIDKAPKDIEFSDADIASLTNM